MKTLILYTSQFGATAQYARWLRDSLPGADLMDIHTFEQYNVDFANYDWVVIGSSVYMGQINAAAFLERHWPELRKAAGGANVFLMVVGMLPEAHESSRQSFALLPALIRKELGGYAKLPGRIDHNRIGFWRRLVLRFMSADQDVDLVSREALRPVLEVLTGPVLTGEKQTC